MLARFLTPHITRLLSSDTLLTFRRKRHELARRLKGKPHTLEVFLSISDPYSYLLVQTLANLTRRFSVDIKIHIVRDKQPDMFPEPEKWQNNAVEDARRLASLYELRFPQKVLPANKALINTYTAQLLTAESDLTKIEALFDAFWFNQHSDIGSKLDEQALKHLQTNQQYQQTLGHYFSAMLHYAGEWYWGLDRLQHLEKRLNNLGLSAGEQSIQFDLQTRNFCHFPKGDKSSDEPLIMYYSARSPYSYLGLEQAVKLCQHYNCPLVVKPVLPMVMRGLQVPDTKKMYIFHDTRREAKVIGLPYGYVADPLGKAVENCYALFEYAKAQGREIDFLLAFGRAVNAKGRYADTPKGMKTIVEQAGLSWQQAAPLLEDSCWREWAEKNMLELAALGQWGVPCFCYKDLTVWGQDRLWAVEQAITTLPQDS